MVHYAKATRPSAELLQQALSDEGYDGPDINWGYGARSDALNNPEAIANAVNKRQALLTMRDAEVPTPTIWLPSLYNPIYPVVGRRDFHTRGRGFFICNNDDEYMRTRRFNRPPTHYLELISDAQEFRVHVVNGNSIKISEKIGEGIIRNYSRDDSTIVFRYPHDFHHKRSLRRIAKEAVEALGLDFGAVDLLYKDGSFYVLEVNTAPSLTDESSDTLQRYVDAFMDY